MSKICTQNLVFSHKSNHFIYNLPVSKLLLLFVFILLYCCYNIKIYVLTMSLWHGRVSGTRCWLAVPCFITSVHWPELHESQRGPQWFMWGKFPQSKTCRHQSLFPLWWHLKAQQTFCVCVRMWECVHMYLGNVLAKLWPHMVSTITELQRLLTYLLSSSEENHLARSTEFLLDRILQTSGELRKMKREMKMN